MEVMTQHARSSTVRGRIIAITSDGTGDFHVHTAVPRTGRACRYRYTSSQRAWDAYARILQRDAHKAAKPA